MGLELNQKSDNGLGQVFLFSLYLVLLADVSCVYLRL